MSEVVPIPMAAPSPKAEAEFRDERKEEKERLRRERKKLKLQRALSKLEAEERGELSTEQSDSDGSHKPMRRTSTLKKIRTTMKRKKHQKLEKLLEKITAIEDHRSEEEQVAVREFREILVAEGLLPQRHDNYHTLLRY